MNLAELNFHRRINDYRVVHKFRKVFNAYPTSTLIQMACRTTGITVEKFKSQSRQKQVLNARRLVSIYLTSNTGWTLATIGQVTRMRDHATVLNDIRRFREFKATNDKEWNDIEIDFLGRLVEYSNDYSIFMNPKRYLNDTDKNSI